MGAIILIGLLAVLESTLGQLTNIPQIPTIPQIPNIPSMSDGALIAPKKPIPPTSLPAYPAAESSVPVYPSAVPTIPTYPSAVPTIPTYPPAVPTIPTYPPAVPSIPTYPPVPTIPSYELPGQLVAQQSYSGSSDESGSSVNDNVNWYNTNLANTIDVPFTKSIAKFSINFYEKICSTNKGNVIMSPFSAQTALSLLYCGAGGDTATTMADSLEFQNQTSTAITTQYQKILTPLQNNPSLTIANAIYVTNNLKIQPNFMKKATNDFYAKVAKIDFSQSVAAVNTINDWVATETHNKIKNLLTPDDVDADTASVLLNAIYFKGTWVHHFPPTRTQPAAFNISREMSVQVPMMHVTAYFNYNFIKHLNAQVIELAYAKSEVTMVLILPKNVDELPALQQAFKTFDLTTLEKHLESQKVILSMPKFTIETTLNLKNPLKSMGLGAIFSDSANFSNMLTNNNGMVTPLVVSKVIQKAYIEVDETGATAAAVTAITMTDGAPNIPWVPPIYFNASHPFIFLLKTPVSPLFIGTYNGP